jgi:molecular chaperone DnaJ
MRNYYEILGLSKDASQEDIKKAYRKLAVQHHPDKGGDESKFKEIAEAYDTLGDEKKRQQYNFKLENPFAGNMGGGNPFGGGPSMDDLFSSFFGGNPFANQQQQQRRAPEKLIDVELSVLESYLGISKVITYNKKNPCNSCSGKGGDRSACMTCGSQGFVMQRVGTGMFTQVIRTSCPSCNGNGFTVSNPCGNCKGQGNREFIESISVNFPRNINNEQMLRVAQKGDFVNGMIGDLILKIKLVSEKGFEKSNNDLVYNAFFNLNDLKNTEFEIPHPDGKISVKFPKEFNTQIPLRIKGKGFKENSVGDLYVKMNVKYTRD